MTIHKLSYLFKKNWPFLFAILALFILYLWIVYTGQIERFNTSWQKYADSVIGLITLVIAFLVWYQESSESYREALPKRLTVHFVHVTRIFDEETMREVMRCDKAILSHEGDVRALAQQIGRQMSGNERDLKLRPMLDMLKKDIEKERGEPYMHYVVTIVLLELLPNLQGLLDSNRMLLWEPPHMEAAKEVETERES